MADIDKQKEWVGFWKTAFFSIMGLIVGVFTYIFQMYKKSNNIELIILNILIIFLVIASALILKKLKKEIDKLGEM